MASHRSRGSGSSSSRTHSVIYRPPNFISRGISNIAAGLNTHKLWIDFILFGFASTVLLGISSVAYWSFYYYYIPQISVQHDVHLQFGEGHPYGFVDINSDLRSFQNYDVLVNLQLPRTPSNIEAGNFMVDLSIYSKAGQQALQESLSSPSSSSSEDKNEGVLDLSAYRIAHSRRTGILTYASRLVDTANRLAQMPFYLTGVAREAEKLTVPLIQSIQFTRGKNHMPGVLKVEIQSEQRMQIYGASVKIDARFSGLRYLMYHWKALSFIAFSSAFWITSMLFAGATWIYLASGGLANEAEGLSDATSTKKEDEGDDETVKREQQPGMRGVYYTGGMAPYAQYDSYIKPEPIVEGELPTSGLMRIPEYRGESQSPQTVKQEEISEDEGGVDVKKEEILDDEESNKGEEEEEKEEEPSESDHDTSTATPEKNTHRTEEGETSDEEAKKESEEEIVDDAKKEEAKILESTIIAPLSPVSGHKVGATTQSQLEGHQSPGEEISKTVQRRKSRPLSPDSGEEDDEYDHL